MDFVQGPIATLHRLRDSDPSPPSRPFSAVVPMAGGDVTGQAALDVLAALDALEPVRIVLPVRASATAVARLDRRVASLSTPTDVLWCNAPTMAPVRDRLPVGAIGKGGDVWLALGVAMVDAEVVCCVDADVTSINAADVAALVGALDDEIGFAKAYYARVEADRLYGRLFRLLYRPLVLALADRHEAAVLRYLAAFRYALAGEFAVRSDVARDWAVPAGMGLEVGTLGEAFHTPGPSGTVQVDLGWHRHVHRPVAGPDGLEGIAPALAGALFDVVDGHLDDPIAPADLAGPYHAAAHRLIDAHRRDAAFNGLEYDVDAERAQVERYASGVVEPNRQAWLPAWSAIDLEPATVAAASRRAIELRAD